MKIQCNACEAAEAKVMCCADVAALCLDCDRKVHAANKLAGKHPRVTLIAATPPSRLPKCDICQEASGYFFCLEDRALFCRSCDVSIHTANSLVSSHRRFLVTGVQVALEPADALPSIAKERSNSSAERVVEQLPYAAEANQVIPIQASRDGYFGQSKASYSEADVVGSLPDWSVDDLFGFTDFYQDYSLQEQCSSKADSGKLRGSEGSPPCFPTDMGVDFDECLCQVPEISYDMVPEIPSPPTASGLHWQRNLNYPGAEQAAFVPDISSHNFNRRHRNTKRRRPCYGNDIARSYSLL